MVESSSGMEVVMLNIMGPIFRKFTLAIGIDSVKIPEEGTRDSLNTAIIEC